MKKYLKIFALIAVSYTAGEIITQWRAHPEPISLSSYIKLYYNECREQISAVKEKIDSDPATDHTGELKLLMFPNREQ